MRIVGMSGWILWVVAGIFENIGVVQEGMETISRANQVVDRADSKPLVVRAGEIRFDDVTFHYGRRPAPTPARARHRAARRHHPQPLAADRAGREGRPGRPLGRRQVDARQPAAALLRPGVGPHPHRRPGHRPRHAGQPARADRHGHAGHLAAASLRARQHPLRPSRCRRDGRDHGRQAGAGRRLHRRARGPARAARPTRRTSASAASSCRAASASAWRSPACC